MSFVAKVLRVVAQRLVQAVTLVLAGLAPLFGGGRVDQPEADVPVDVASVPPAIEGGQVVSGGGRQGIVRPVEDRFEAMTVLLFEQQHTHAEDRAGGQFFPQTVGHRAEVFAEDDRLVP